METFSSLYWHPLWELQLTYWQHLNETWSSVKKLCYQSTQSLEEKYKNSWNKFFHLWVVIISDGYPKTETQGKKSVFLQPESNPSPKIETRTILKTPRFQNFSPNSLYLTPEILSKITLQLFWNIFWIFFISELFF